MWIFLLDCDCAEERSCPTHSSCPLCLRSRRDPVGDHICYHLLPSSFEQQGYLTTAMVCFAEAERLKFSLPL